MSSVSSVVISSPKLQSNDVHVWRVPPNQSLEKLQLLRQILSSDEQETADRFHFEKDRNHFIQSRSALRRILSQYLNVAPNKIEFAYGPAGKPSLAGDLSASGLRFSLSRRDGLTLIAVTYGREIGVDLELVQSDFPIFEVAEASFSPAELATLRNLPQHERTAGFYNCWTRKEAFVKAQGEGLSYPLQKFDVSLAPGEPARLLHVADNDVDRWTLQELPIDPNYVAALAVEGTDLMVICRDWVS